MDGPEHYARGEDFLRQAEDPSLANGLTSDRAAYIAHTHFTAAIAAGILGLDRARYMPPMAPKPFVAEAVTVLE